MDWELIWWVLLGIVAIFVLIASFLPWNDKYNPKEEDPYKYCPREE